MGRRHFPSGRGSQRFLMHPSRGALPLECKRSRRPGTRLQIRHPAGKARLQPRGAGVFTKSTSPICGLSAYTMVALSSNPSSGHAPQTKHDMCRLEAHVFVLFRCFRTQRRPTPVVQSCRQNLGTQTHHLACAGVGVLMALISRERWLGHDTMAGEAPSGATSFRQLRSCARQLVAIKEQATTHKHGHYFDVSF